VRERQASVVAALLPRVRDVRRFGSAALDLAWTAAGRVDAYFERDVKIWDVAAGSLLCERAGLAVRRLEPRGNDLPAGLLAAPAALADALEPLVA
jgi:myo-inositol-1(or 4)-monophosphatase